MKENSKIDKNKMFMPIKLITLMTIKHWKIFGTNFVDFPFLLNNIDVSVIFELLYPCHILHGCMITYDTLWG